jgi:hypothetical protein
MDPAEVFAKYPPAETAQKLMDTWGWSHRAFMRVVDLSASWTSILKLQIYSRYALGTYHNVVCWAHDRSDPVETIEV